MDTTVLQKGRKSRGFSQTELAYMVGISASKLSQVENLDASLSLKHWRRLARILKLSTKHLCVEVDGDFFARERRHQIACICP